MSYPAPLNPESAHGLASSRFLPIRSNRPRAENHSVGTSRFGLPWNLWQQRPSMRSSELSRGPRVLIVGAGPMGRELAEILHREPIHGRTVIGFLDPVAPVVGDVLGRVENLARIARAEFIDEIIVAIPNQHDLALHVIQEARRSRLNIRAVPDLYGYGWTHDHIHTRPLDLEYFGNLPVLTVHEEQAAAPGLFWKRTVDIALSAASLLVTAPLMAVIAFAIKIASPGPVLYGATRVGLKGRRFVCYKFRTMVRNAEQLKEGLRASNERRGPCFKMAADPRVTHVGRFLRRYSLDELPQLWNVLRGEMSMVGPRPHPLDDFEHYRLEHLRRLDVTPGITGMWQVTARSDPSFQRNMALDLEYIERWSLSLDFWILWKTAFVVLHGTGT